MKSSYYFGRNAFVLLTSLILGICLVNSVSAQNAGTDQDHIDFLLVEDVLSEQSLSISLCYELQGSTQDFVMYYYDQEQNLEECRIFLKEWDSDGDWYGDKEERTAGTDPANTNSRPSYQETACIKGTQFPKHCLDSDFDDFYDEEELAAGTDPKNLYSSPWWLDLDFDGQRNLDELRRGENPVDNAVWGPIDTDRDGYPDEYELSVGSDSDDPFDQPVQVVTESLPEYSDSKTVQETDQDKEDYITQESISESIPQGIMSVTDYATSENKKGTIMIFVASFIVLLLVFVFAVILILRMRNKQALEVNLLVKMIEGFKHKGYDDDTIIQKLSSQDQKLLKKAMAEYSKR
ncbi:hypothetical protein HQ545_08465 [Candidatus Woesearchaeota archaeon]|nr:hypothetical protein [Candidatus Woesearchaeota archaeon]